MAYCCWIIISEDQNSDKSIFYELSIYRCIKYSVLSLKRIFVLFNKIISINLPIFTISYERLTNLKTKSKDMKVLLSMGSTGLTIATLSTLESRSEFVRTSIKFLKKYKLDGLDLDIRYILSRKSAQKDIKRSMLLLQVG